MRIEWASDIGAPVAVAAVDIITQETKPDWNEWASYVLAGGGYLAAMMGLGSTDMQTFAKSVGMSAFPLAARNIYTRFAVGKRVAFRPAGAVRRRAAPIRQTAFPDFETVKVS